LVDPRISAGVKQVPEPLSPRNRNRVPKVSNRSRSHGVKYEPGSHIIKESVILDFLCAFFGFRRRTAALAPALTWTFLVAGAGFEPATFGL
jgi:hypothetical protein